jgi:glycosyltransferase involved in cell wall biosynthesis
VRTSKPRILSLNQWLDTSPTWRGRATPITDLSPGWHSLSLFRQLSVLFGLRDEFDVIHLHYDKRLPLLLGVLLRLCRRRPRLVWASLLCDVSWYRIAMGRPLNNMPALRSYVLHKLLINLVDVCVVHSSAEIATYAEIFAAPASKFAFVPYYAYGTLSDAERAREQTIDPDAEPYVLACGRHRDYRCFIKAMRGLPYRGLIVAGDSDRSEIAGNLSSNVEVRFEVPIADFEAAISQASVVVIPLYADRWQRSLGQIAMFSATLRGKPIVAARTTQLIDYVSDDDVLFYEAGDSRHLREQIVRVLTEPDLRERIIKSATLKLLTDFSEERHAARLIEICDEAVLLRTAVSGSAGKAVQTVRRTGGKGERANP